MGKFKNLILLVFAITLAVGAGVGAISYIEKQEELLIAEQNAKMNYQKIIVASSDLAPGQVVSADTVSVLDVPAAYVPDGALLPEDFEKLAGLVLDSPASAGKPLMRTHLGGMDAVERFSELIQKGYRSVTLRVSSLDTAENLLTVGDFIDVLLMTGEGDSARSFALMLNRVMVLATGVSTVSNIYETPYDEGYSTITVAVKAEEFPAIIAAREQGSFVYALRNPEDDASSNYAKSNASTKTVAVFSGGDSKNGMLQKTQYNVVNNSHSWPESKGKVIQMYKPERPGVPSDIQDAVK